MNFMMVHEGHFKCVRKAIKNDNTMWEFQYVHIFGPNRFFVQCELQPNDQTIEVKQGNVCVCVCFSAPLLKVSLPAEHQVLCTEEGNLSNRACLFIDLSKFVEDSWTCSANGSRGLTWTTALKNSDLLALIIKVGSITKASRALSSAYLLLERCILIYTCMCVPN